MRRFFHDADDDDDDDDDGDGDGRGFDFFGEMGEMFEDFVDEVLGVHAPKTKLSVGQSVQWETLEEMEDQTEILDDTYELHDEHYRDAEEKDDDEVWSNDLPDEDGGETGPVNQL